MAESLTTLERRIYHYLIDFLAENTYQPSIREIGKRFRIKSTKTVSDLLQSLADKGFIERDPSRSRGVRLVGYSGLGRTQPVLRPPGPTSSALPPPAAAPIEERGSGPVVGTPGPARGARPSFSDPRVWVPPADVVSAPKTPTERLDSTFQARLKAHQDSVELAAGPRRDPTDWTLERDGKKYGIDKTYIHLGNLRLPTALLALLPMNAQGNQQAIDRERALNAMHNDIMYQAQRAMNEDEFRAAVKRIRERRERERREAEEQKQKVQAP